MDGAYTILVPVDGSAHALKALRIAGDLTEKYSGRVVLLHVLARNRKAADLLRLGVARQFGEKLAAALRAAAERQEQDAGDAAASVPPAILRAIGEKILQEAQARLSKRNVPSEILDMEDGDPAEAILLAARRTGANIIAMGCRGVSDSGTGSLGSVSRDVFAQAECTCISVK